MMRTAFILFVLWMLSGCATQNEYADLQQSTGLPAKFELSETSFFSDDRFFCGPAALATVLSAADIKAQPQMLAGEVFLPGRKGALQIEMLAGARRHGAVAVIIPAQLEDLLREVAAGHPVLVLQNLGLSWAPSWHYAVVVGYDLNERYLALRSGTIKRQELSIRTFEYTWNRSERWAFVVLQPGNLPVTATEDEAEKALVAFERNAQPLAAIKAYRSGLARWPNNISMAMGLGNSLYAAGNYVASEKIFRQVAHRHSLPAAYNNQAYVLLKLGRYKEAKKAVKKGLMSAGPLRPALLDTLELIDKAEPK